MIGRELLPERPEGTPWIALVEVLGHAHDATPKVVTRGCHLVPILRRPAARAEPDWHTA